MIKTINGADYKGMLASAAAAVENNKQALNDLNVFPVPDGDTGTNMSMTLNYAVNDLRSFEVDKIGKMAEKASSLLTRGSHGNSGCITSLLFSGMAKLLREADTADAAQLAAAMKAGVDKAYSVVNKPAEGTILTVARKAAAAAAEAARESGDVEATLAASLDEAYQALAQTPQQNPVLAKAGVVDAGGKGLCCIYEGMLAALRGKPVTAAAPSEDEGQKKPESVFAGYTSEDIHFAYCTELIVLRQPCGLLPSALKLFLESRGDCVVLVEDDEILKLHIHTNNPGQVLEECLRYGALTAIKIENMREQHTQKLEMETASEPKTAAPEKKYGFVAVAAGEGIKGVFKDLGIDKIVEGGQTMNPSTADILNAVNSTPAEVVFVLPNNKNIILAAEQAVELTEKKLIVIPTRTIPEGVTAMLGYDPEAEPEENAKLMTAGLSGVRTGHITYAARDSVFDNMHIRAGDYLALAGSKLSRTGSDLSEIAGYLADSLNLAEAEFVTVFCGEDATDEGNAELEKALRAHAGKRTEFSIINGGQPVYYYIIGAE